MRRVLLAIVGTVAGLVGLLSFKTHTTSVAGAPAAISATGPATTTTPAVGASGGTGSSRASTSSSTASSSPASSSKTVTGNSVDTRWGPVQVRITVTNGTLTSVTAVDYPNGNPRDQEINSYAIPELNTEALAAGSAKIDMISGATYTSDGYISSLQSALNEAGR